MPESDKEQLHIKELQPDLSHKKGCVTKHEGSFDKPTFPDCAYRVNGYNSIMGDAKKKKLYCIDFTKKRASARLPYLYREYMIGNPGGKDDPKSYRFADNPTEDTKAWNIGEGGNYKIGHLPFNHNYHHILPFDALKPMEYEELKILQQSGYNLNAGMNLIILPCLDSYGYAMRLPTHLGNHADYTWDVKQVIIKIKQSFAKESPEHKLAAENVGRVKEELEKWEESEFWVLVEYGQSKAKSKDPQDRMAMVNDAPVAMRRTTKGYKV